ncbi:MAG: glycosyltransferase family 2 protein [Pseudomonadota bacterium]
MHNAAMKVEAELQPESALAFAERDLHRLVTVVIVTYRSAKVVPAALASVPSGVPVVVVDNDSRDPSAALAAAADATVVRNDRNLGFGTACNQGAAVARTPFILFLNPDARLRPGSLAKLVSTLLADGLVAAAGPILTTAGRVLRPRRATLLDLGEMPTFAAAPSTPCDVGFISGAAMLVRTDAFRAIGGFDERIFLYLEDDDLCVRLRSAGWRLRLAPEAVVAHEIDTRPSAADGHSAPAQQAHATVDAVSCGQACPALRLRGAPATGLAPSSSRALPARPEAPPCQSRPPAGDRRLPFRPARAARKTR